MDFLILQQYGQETYQRKEYSNLYEYIQIINLVVENFLNRQVLNLANFRSLLENSQEYYINFKEKYYELTPDQIQMLPMELEKAFVNINSLKSDNLYQDGDEYYIFKYIDLIYNVKFLYDMYQQELPILEKYFEFDIKVQTQQMINLNTNEPIENQVFYQQQELKDNIKDYFKKDLEGKIFSNILQEELDYLLMFPSMDFWIFGVYLLIDNIYKMELDFLDYFESYNIEDNFLNDLKSFQKYNNYENYTLKLLKEKKSNYISYYNYFEKDLNYIWMLENFYKNNLLPKDYFLTFSKTLLKTPLEANQFIKIEFYNLLNIAINTENVINTKILIASDEIFNAKIREKQNKLDKLMLKSTDIEVRTDLDIKESGTDVLAVLCFLELINNNITIEQIPIDYDMFVAILSRIGLLQTDLDQDLYLIKNGIIKKDRIEYIANNYIKQRIFELKDALLITECYNKLGSLPTKKEAIVDNQISNNLPYNNFVSKIENKKINIDLPEINKKKNLETINSQTKNNVLPNIATKNYLASFAIKNVLYTKKVTEESKELLEIFPVTRKLKGCKSLDISQKQYNESKDKLTDKELKDSLNKNYTMDSSLKVQGNITINENDPINNILNKDNIPTEIASPKTIILPDNSVKETGDYFTNLSDSITSFFDSNTNSIDESFLDPENTYLDKLKEHNSNIIDWISNNVSGPVGNIISKISDWISNVNANINAYLNSFRGFFAENAGIIQSVLTGISNFISAILCVLQAFLCMLGEFLNLGKTLKKSLTDFKNTLSNLVDGGSKAASELLNSVNSVVDSIMDTFGINVKGICSDTSSSYLNNISNELSDLASNYENQFVQNFDSMVDRSMKCKFKSPFFNFGRLSIFNFGFRPGIPPALYFKVPKC